ncbi:nitrobindin family protein [Nesterenkonia aerolata]|uniref:Peroxynitrite isomerase n=1 Tax=Nesterenkonia aerolata TaxID=3074079 RepID=A0ABU2DTF6_9MICC|nr:FABP family protein [Nesterenkonia sp. LY-0111]MDR8019784.1 FABP family protein [Nesterenkonia sp. LY-0111]
MAPMELPTDLTPELVPLYWLLGTWEGGGRLGAGEESDPPFAQQVTFRDSGLEFVEYRAETSLTDESGARLRTLSVETGFWALDRPRVESDVGPGLTPADVVPVYRSAEDVQQLAGEDGSFPITATITHPGSLTELYYGRIKGPQLQITTDAVMRGENAAEYPAATRMFGLVEEQLFWRWDVQGPDGEMTPHASAVLRRTGSARTA